MIISRRPVPLPLIISWAHRAQSNPNALSYLAAAIVGGRIALEWAAPNQHAASTPGTPQVGETLTANIPNVVDADVLHHAAFTCHRAVGAAAHAGIQDATGTARSLSDELEDDGRLSKVPTPSPTTKTTKRPLPERRSHITWGHAERRQTRRWKLARDQRDLAATCSWRPDAGITAPPSNPGRSAEAAWQRTAPTSRSGHCQRARRPAAEPETSIRTGAGKSSPEIDASHGQTQADSSRDAETPTRDTP